jgi:tetratricopeptide (TPR) repeat protein
MRGQTRWPSGLVRPGGGGALEFSRRPARRSAQSRSQLWYFRAFVEFTDGDMPRAIAAYENVLRVPDLVPALQQNTLLSLAQLYASVEQFTPALETLDRWSALVDDPAPHTHVFRAQILYQLGRYNEALEPLEIALEAPEASEQWYTVKVAIQNELGDRQGMIETLEFMNATWPSEDRARQLDAVILTPDR